MKVSAKHENVKMRQGARQLNRYAEKRMLDKLIKLLDLPDTDYWSDIACDDARKIIDDSPEIIFAQLLKDWKKWPPSRQEHLAYILGQGLSELEKKLIEQMLNADNPDVAYRASEARDDLNKNHKVRPIGSDAIVR